MTDDVKIWLPPMLTLLGTLIVVTFTAWLSSRSVHAMIDAVRQEIQTVRQELQTVRHEMRAEIAGVRSELKLDILRIENKIDHYAETQASHSERIERLERRA